MFVSSDMENLSLIRDSLCFGGMLLPDIDGDFLWCYLVLYLYHHFIMLREREILPTWMSSSYKLLSRRKTVKDALTV
jgi:hypothetical protein